MSEKEPINDGQHSNDDTPNEETNPQMAKRNESQEIPLRRSQRIRKPTIPSYYKTYLQKSDIGINTNTVSFSEVIDNVES